MEPDGGGCAVTARRACEIILVVDNHKPLFERAKSLVDLVTIENSRARGTSGLRSSGIAIERGSVIERLDGDVVAGKDRLERLIELCQQDVAGSGGSIEPSWTGTPPQWSSEEFICKGSGYAISH